jgi:hypothetical protein
MTRCGCHILDLSGQLADISPEEAGYLSMVRQLRVGDPL